MLFVINKSALQGAISVVRDDRSKKTQGPAGPFLRLEAKDNSVKLEGNEVSANIPATVYEPGVLFLRVTIFRRLLKTFTKEKFLTIQVMSEGLLVENVTLSLEGHDMLLYLNPDQAPRFHPSVKLKPLPKVSKPKPKPTSHQLLLWDISPTVPLGPETHWEQEDLE